MKKKINDYLQTKWAGRELVHYQETDSTNIRAKNLGIEGIHGTLIVADSQTAGRGRRGRTWESPERQNIYMTLYLRPEFSISKAPMLTILMAYSVAKALRDRFEVIAQIKWPNDLVLNKKKICGILTEMSVKQNVIDYVVIGVGINVGNQKFPDELKRSATSLLIETGQQLPKEKIIAEVLNVFEKEYEMFCEADDLSWMRGEYNQMLVNCGKEVVVLSEKGEYHAQALGINAKGELQIEKEDGARENIFAGEVSVRGIYGYV